MKKIVSYVVVGGLAALVLSGCAAAQAAQVEPDGPSATPKAGSTTVFEDGLLTYERTKVDGGYISMMARTSGTISFENGCLLVDGAPMVFPADITSWDGTTLTVSGQDFVVGDEIVVGGGGISIRLPENTPDQCGGLTPFYASDLDTASEPLAPPAASPTVTPDGPAPEPTAGSTTTFTDGLLTYQVINVEGTLVGHMGSRLEGALTFDNGCLLVAGHPVVFPADVTSWDGTTLMANGNEFVLGDTIVLGGGAPPDAKLPENAPDQCGGMAPWYASGAVALGLVID